MDDFGTIYDRMSANYSAIENMMGVIYSQIQDNPSNSQLLDTLYGLGDIAKGILQSQISFTETYCKDSIKDSLVSNLIDRYDTLQDALNKTNGRTL